VSPGRASEKVRNRARAGRAPSLGTLPELRGHYRICEIKMPSSRGSGVTLDTRRSVNRLAAIRQVMDPSPPTQIAIHGPAVATWARGGVGTTAIDKRPGVAMWWR